MNMKLLVCGGCGFIGSEFIRNHLKKKPQDKIINLDSLTIGSNKANLKPIEKNENYSFVHGDIRNLELVEKLTKDVDAIINFAAETHVDRSISNPKPFIETNVIGTYNLLEGARKNEKLMVHISTDEIYGDAEAGKSFTEEDPPSPSNPYSATKAAADHLVKSYHRTYGLKCFTTRCTNNFGSYQFPEKLVPKTIIRAFNLISNGKSGEVYNITAWNEITNKTIVEKILELLGKSHDLIEYVGDRPGHDRRYSIDASKIQKETGWKPKYEFEQALKETVDWYIKNQQWWEPLVDEKTIHPQPWTLSWK